MELKKQAVSTGSSGSDASPLFGSVDERKRKRMISNRESARRSRMKRLKQMDDLIDQVTQLKSNNNQMMQRLTASEQSYIFLAAEKDIVQAEAISLTNRLQYLNEVNYIAEQVKDVPETPELFAEPWHLPYQSPKFSISANMFQC